MDYLKRDIQETLHKVVRDKELGPDQDAAILARIGTQVSSKEWGSRRRIELRWVGVACVCMLMLFMMTEPWLQRTALAEPARQVSPWVSSQITPGVRHAEIRVPTMSRGPGEATPVSPDVHVAPNPIRPGNTRVPGQFDIKADLGYTNKVQMEGL